MRPIDDLREKIDLWKKSTTDTALMSVLHDVLKQIDVAIYEMGNQEAESTWHRVAEELPEIGQIVLVYDEWRRLSICQLDNSYRWLRQGGGWFNGPCACYWMPIEPPKED